MRALRGALGTVGVLVGTWGAVELLALGRENLGAASVWLLGGVVVHDAVLAPFVLAVVAVGARVLPRWARGAAAAALVVLGSVTVMAVPVLGRFGARPDNATLLDRDYGRGWLVIAGLVLVCAVVGAGRRRGGTRRASNASVEGTGRG